LQLLVSVRSAAEVAPALAGGAHIIDAKEPSRGSLGRVEPHVLSEILESVPGDYPVSVALGDFRSVADVRAALRTVAVPARHSPIYLKLGFAGVPFPEQIARLLDAAVSATQARAAPWHIVAVAYADAERAGTVSPMLIPRLAQAAGASGTLMDTWSKDGRGLLNWLSSDILASWVAEARKAGLFTALAGSLRPDDLMLVSQAAPDVIGARGAVCVGGREGIVSEYRVRQFRRCLPVGSSGGSPERALPTLRETQDTGAISLT
jgi:uncharacterized protein (UPF0264 family)